MSEIIDEGPGVGWQLSSSGLPLPPKPFHDMSHHEWKVFLEVFLSCARERARRAEVEAAAGTGAGTVL